MVDNKEVVDVYPVKGGLAMRTLEEQEALLSQEAEHVLFLLLDHQLIKSQKAFYAMAIHHKDAKRSGGLSYKTHPIRVAYQLMLAGVYIDDIIGAALLHDVLEDCDVTPMDLMVKDKISEGVIDIVKLLTKEKGYDEAEYYSRIGTSPEAILVKLSDRLHNLSTMHGAFSKKKMMKYIAETKAHVLPLCDEWVSSISRYTTSMQILKQQIETLLDIYESLLVTES